MQHLMLYTRCHLMQFNPLGEGRGRSAVPFGEMEEKAALTGMRGRGRRGGGPAPRTVWPMNSFLACLEMAGGVKQPKRNLAQETGFGGV